MMILVNNGLPQSIEMQTEWKLIFVRILHPFAPHLAEELNERNGSDISVFKQVWPEFDESKTVDNTIVIGVQVLGKLRGEIEIAKDEDKDSVLEKAKANENVAKWLEGKTVVKEIYVPGKIVNLVVK
jgi:leucyl-tRNA synthetase